jgi:predicted metal-binding membrane protein
MRQSITHTESTLRRDRLIVFAGLVSISAMAWAYLISHTFAMGTMEMAMEMAASMQAWTAMDFVLRFVMWAVMMIAMMVPTAAAMILAFATINRRRRLQAQPYLPTAIFLGGYVVVWTGFSVLATLAQWGLHEAALLSPMMASTSPILGGLLLLTAGVYQWTPLKYACLKHCRSPLGFLMTEWREGLRGTLIMGIRHGLYCTGCCGFLMALLFVAGVMNLLWVATISLFVLVEKVVPRGDIVGRVAGGVLVIAGVVLLGHGFG